MALLMVVLLWTILVTMLPSEEEVDVWAWTPDFNLIIVEDDVGEPVYGLQNRHTHVIEIQEPVFSNAVNYLIQLQEEYDAAASLIGEDGGLLLDGMVKVTFKPKKETHH